MRNVIRTAKALKNGTHVYTMTTRTLRVEFHYNRAAQTLTRRWFGAGMNTFSARVEHNISPGTAMAVITGGLAFLGQPRGKRFAI